MWSLSQQVGDLQRCFIKRKENVRHNPFVHAFFLPNGCSAKKAANRTFKLEALLEINLPNLLPKANVLLPAPHTHSSLERWPSNLLVNTSFEPISPETLILCWTALIVQVLPCNRVFLKVQSVDHLHRGYLRHLLKSQIPKSSSGILNQHLEQGEKQSSTLLTGFPGDAYDPYKTCC